MVGLRQKMGEEARRARIASARPTCKAPQPLTSDSVEAYFWVCALTTRTPQMWSPGLTRRILGLHLCSASEDGQEYQNKVVGSQQLD